MIGIGEALIIGGIVVLVFGASQLPKLGRSLGIGLKEFKKAVTEAKGEDPMSLPEGERTPEKKNGT
jgi:sec-independent protein translocase protein TatA